MKRIIKIIKNNYKIIIGFIIGLLFSLTTVYAVDAYIESNKVAYTNHNKTNVQEALDELYEKSGVHQEKWIDPILNGADPVLKEPLIPIEINDDGEAYYANLNSEWYNYKKRKWANAVILNDNINYNVGDKIDDKDIKGYFVWIPRYQSKVWDLGQYTSALNGNTLTNKEYSTSTTNALNNSRIIDIKFGDINKIPKMAESEATIDNYYTHPAFTLGNKDLNGIWVGKFETGGSASNVIVKPNVSSWREATVKEFFNAGKNYAIKLDSHMMKNTEWGAVAYLSHSVYGIGTEVNINNAEDYYTGYSAAPNTDQSTREGTYALHTDTETTQPWDSPVGYLASTRGNISGIYDMSGGAWEYVAAYRRNSGTTNKSGFSEDEIIEQISQGYIDEYASDSSAVTYDKRILGDATGEMGPFYRYYDGDGKDRSHNSWYADFADFLIPSSPWFVRSGHYGCGGVAGQFLFNRNPGDAVDSVGFRIALAL